MSAMDAPEGRAGCGEDTAAYALGALSEQEASSFEEHLRTCARCREELAALQPVVDALPSAVPQRTAPAELRGRVLATVRSEAELRGGRERPELGAPPGRARSWRPWRLAWAGLAVAAVSAAIALAIAGNEPTHTRVISAHAGIPGTRAVLRVTGNRGQLRIAGMPQAPRGHVYELWIERDGAAQPTDALFTVSSTGRASVGVPGSLKGASAVMVTAEPLGGSAQPTGAPVIVARVG